MKTIKGYMPLVSIIKSGDISFRVMHCDYFLFCFLATLSLYGIFVYLPPYYFYIKQIIIK